MESYEENKREKNPRDDASWFSILTYIFALRMFRKSRWCEIKEEDVYETVNALRSKELGNKLEKVWKHELFGRKASLLRSIAKLIWFDYIVISVSCLLIELPLMMVYPFVLGKIVSYFTPGQTEVTLNDELLYVAKLMTIWVTFILYGNLYYLLAQELTTKIRISLTSLMYRKCLNLSPTSLASCGGGKVVTLITKDVLQLNNAIDFSLYTITGIAQAVIMAYLMYRQIGPAALLGISLLLVLLPFQEEPKIGRLSRRKAIKLDS